MTRVSRFINFLHFWYSSAVFSEVSFYLVWFFSVSLGTVRNAPFYATNSQLLKASFNYVCRHLTPFCPRLLLVFDLTISEFIVFFKDAYVGLLLKFTKTSYRTMWLLAVLNWRDNKVFVAISVKNFTCMKVCFFVFSQEGSCNLS